MRGIVAVLPMPRAPIHIVVMKRLKSWKDAELIDAELHEQMRTAVLTAAHDPAPGSVGILVIPQLPHPHLRACDPLLQLACNKM